MKVVLVSTMNTNIGDDLIRAGVQRLITRALPGRVIEWQVVNKHNPLSVYRGWGAAGRLVRSLPRGEGRLTRLATSGLNRVGATTVFDGSDLVIQCGTPIMWRGVHRAEWHGAVWEGALSRRRAFPVLNVAAGACYPWLAERPVALAPEDERALRAVVDVSDHITVRDPLAEEIVNRLGGDARRFACAALHAGQGRQAPVSAGRLILNIMPGGGHFAWGVEDAARRWVETVDQVVAARRDDSLLMLCHSAKERDLAVSRWPGVEAVLPRTVDEYLTVIRTGRVGLVNRMHAAVAMAGVGVPAVAVGSDTRMLMVAECGQEIEYLPEATAARLLDRVAVLEDERAARRVRLAELEGHEFEAHAEYLSARLIPEGRPSARP